MERIALIVFLLLALGFVCADSSATKKELEWYLNNPDE